MIFTYNVMLSVYRHFGGRHFEHINEILRKHTKVNAHILPIISYPEDSIESRAKQAATKIPEVLLGKGRTRKCFLTHWLIFVYQSASSEDQCGESSRHRI